MKISSIHPATRSVAVTATGCMVLSSIYTEHETVKKRSLALPSRRDMSVG